MFCYYYWYKINFQSRVQQVAIIIITKILLLTQVQIKSSIVWCETLMASYFDTFCFRLILFFLPSQVKKMVKVRVIVEMIQKMVGEEVLLVVVVAEELVKGSIMLRVSEKQQSFNELTLTSSYLSSGLSMKASKIATSTQNMCLMYNLLSERDNSKCQNHCNKLNSHCVAIFCLCCICYSVHVCVIHRCLPKQTK